MKTRYWDPAAECLRRRDLEALQLEHLRATVRRVQEGFFITVVICFTP